MNYQVIPDADGERYTVLFPVSHSHKCPDCGAALECGAAALARKLAPAHPVSLALAIAVKVG